MFRTRGGQERIFRLAGSASRSAPRAVALTLVHTHATDPAEVLVRLKGGEAEHVRHTILTDLQLNAHNTFERPDALTPNTKPNESRGKELRCTVPPASVNRFDIRLA
jgi:alpha-L-arabinofuranosidase